MGNLEALTSDTRRDEVIAFLKQDPDLGPGVYNKGKLEEYLQKIQKIVKEPRHGKIKSFTPVTDLGCDRLVQLSTETEFHPDDLEELEYNLLGESETVSNIVRLDYSGDVDHSYTITLHLTEGRPIKINVRRFKSEISPGKFRWRDNFMRIPEPTDASPRTTSHSRLGRRIVKPKENPLEKELVKISNDVWAHIYEKLTQQITAKGGRLASDWNEIMDKDILIALLSGCNLSFGNILERLDFKGIDGLYNTTNGVLEFLDTVFKDNGFHQNEYPNTYIALANIILFLSIFGKDKFIEQNKAALERTFMIPASWEKILTAVKKGEQADTLEGAKDKETIDQLARLIKQAEAKENEVTIIGIDTDLFGMKNGAVPLLVELERICRTFSNVKIIRGSGSNGNLKSDVEAELGKVKDKEAKVALITTNNNSGKIQITSQCTISGIKILGVDESAMGIVDGLHYYMPVAELISFALGVLNKEDALAVDIYYKITGQRLDPSLLSQSIINILLPKIEPIDLSKLRARYEGQKQLLHSA
jgi:hypothetical protein